MPIVTQQQHDLYHSEGYMILRDVIPPDMLTMLREECAYFLGYKDSQMDSQGITVDGINRRGSRYFISNLYRLSTRMRNFIFSPMMAEIAQAALGPDVYLFNEQWVVKNAEQGMKFSWHQDSGYLKRSHPDVDHPPYLTCWCTLDDVSEANGTAYILPHSRGGTASKIVDHIADPVTHDLIGYTGDDPGDPVIAPAGSIACFTSYTLHRSGPNLTKHMRRIYLPQYASAPIGGDEIKQWAMAVPFVKDGKVIYDAENDKAEKYGPYPK